MHRPTLAALLVCWVSIGIAQTEAPSAPRKEDQQQSSVRDAYQGGWTTAAAAEEDRPQLDLELFNNGIGTEATLQLEGLRASRNSALNRNQGELTPTDRAVMLQQAEGLNRSFPNSFEGHMASYYAQFPAPTAYQHLELAAELQPERLELVAPLLTKAVREDDRSLIKTAASSLKARGEVAPALFVAANDILLSVERDGILIAAGEMDAFPTLVLQAEGKRPDVLVVDHRLLDDPVYRSRIWRRISARGAVPRDGTSFISALPTSCDRPVFLSLAVGREIAAAHASQLHVTGLAMRLTSKPCCDIGKLESTWKAMRKTIDAGPIGRNYIIPASILLKHYRAIGDEKRSAELEHELRALAQRLGVTRELISNGILQH
ncbi:MAG: hypothetical protein IPM46_16220 [Flavobacteriales bacterium]|nr:hypothetical protein [Flavobacteriales bacterium]